MLILKCQPNHVNESWILIVVNMSLTKSYVIIFFRFNEIVHNENNNTLSYKFEIIYSEMKSGILHHKKLCCDEFFWQVNSQMKYLSLAKLSVLYILIPNISHRETIFYRNIKMKPVYKFHSKKTNTCIKNTILSLIIVKIR